jgi:hypothetical protein
MVKRQQNKIVGGYIGEKEIKSAGNKIYKLIHSPEAQDLGKVALTSLISLAIGSTIKNGISSSQVEVPSAGAPPAGAPPQSQPDIYDSNPMLHFAGLGLPHPAIKSVSEKIHNFIKSPEAKALTSAKLKAQIIRHVMGGGIFDNIKETASTVKRKAKQAGESIYKAITSKEAQILGATGLTLLITGILGKYAYDRRNTGLPKQNNRLTVTVDEDDDTPALRIGKSNLNKLVDNLYQLQDDRKARLQNTDRIKEFYDPNNEGKDIVDVHVEDLRDISNKIKNGEPVDGGLGLKKKVAIKSASERIHNFIKSPEAKSMTKTKLKNRIIKHLQGCGIKQNLKSAGDSIYNIATSPTAQNLGKVALTLLFAKAVEKAIPAAYEANEEYNNRISEQLQRDKAIDRAKKWFDDYSENENKALLNGSTNFSAGGLMENLSGGDLKEQLSNKMANMITHLKKSVDKKYLPYLALAILSMGVHHYRNYHENKKRPNSDDFIDEEYDAGNLVESDKKKEKAEKTFYTKYIKPISNKIIDSDELAIITRFIGSLLEKAIVGELQLALRGSVVSAYRSVFPQQLPVAEVVVAEGLKSKKKIKKLYGGDLKSSFGVVKQYASNSVKSVNDQLNKIYASITSEKGKKIGVDVLKVIAGLCFVLFTLDVAFSDGTIDLINRARADLINHHGNVGDLNATLEHVRELEDVQAITLSELNQMNNLLNSEPSGELESSHTPLESDRVSAFLDARNRRAAILH